MLLWKNDLSFVGMGKANTILTLCELVTFDHKGGIHKYIYIYIYTYTTWAFIDYFINDVSYDVTWGVVALYNTAMTFI